MAFSPDFATSGLVYLSYVENVGGASGTSKVTRFVSADGGLTFAIDPGPNAEVLALVQPFSNHNAATSTSVRRIPLRRVRRRRGAGDPFGHGQDLNTWFGKILRLDVSCGLTPSRRTIPSSASRATTRSGRTACANPWREAFDPVTGKLWCGDVGQNNARRSTRS